MRGKNIIASAVELSILLSMSKKILYQIILVNLWKSGNFRHLYLVIFIFGTGASCLLLDPPGTNWCFSFAPELVGYSARRDLHRRAAYLIYESWYFIHQDVYHDLFAVCS